MVTKKKVVGEEITLKSKLIRNCPKTGNYLCFN